MSEPAPLASASEAVDLDSMTKAQLLDYATENGVSGVNSVMKKAAIIAAITEGDMRCLIK